MANVTCPSAGILSAFAVGCTTDAEALEIETHLATCPQCVAILDGVTADSLVAAVKASLPAVRDGAEHSNSQPFGVEFPPNVRAETTQIYPNVPLDTNLSPAGGTQGHPTEEHYRFLSPSAEPGTIGQLGPYRILAQLGSGGMGAVFRAEDPQLLRPVALKVMRPHALGAAEASQRFLAEARAAARLKHDHVVTVYQVGEDRGVAFIAMELLEGESLDSRLARESRLPIAEACRIGMETASALSAAHTGGLIHRDIKPANLWLDRSSGRTKVLDFGLARATDGDVNLTSSGAILGTPAFMAPEQARGESVDGRTDLFALGVVLYRAITGQLPFRGQSSVGTLLAVTTYSPPTPRSLRAEIPQDLSALVMKLLSKDPAERPQTAAEVVVQLAAIRTRIEQGKVERPDGLGRRSWKAIVAGLLVCGALLAAVVVIIRDKNGNKVAEVTVPGEVSVEVRPQPEQPRKAAAPPNIVAISEPPPLKEWLKGREIIKVTQDGSGDYTTIQAALTALKPGQAINVQGPGPYRENLTNWEMPPDVGIFSLTNALIDCPDWQKLYQVSDADGKSHQAYTGHILSRSDGLRIHGLTFTFPARGERLLDRMVFPNSQNVVIESCEVRATDGAAAQFIHLSHKDDNSAEPMNVTVRDCVIEADLFLKCASPQSTALIERNWFIGAANVGNVIFADGNMSNAVIRQNVFTGSSPSAITIARMSHFDKLAITNNTFTAVSGIGIKEFIPETLKIRNNLHLGNRHLVTLADGAEVHSTPLLRRAEIDHNAYRWLRVSPVSDKNSGDLKSDYTGKVDLLSNAAENPDYLRVSRDDQPLSKGGVGGDLPTYIGALPPGPIGDRGDWFTSLQTRRQKSAPNTPPVATPEMIAPELEEWLKGRTILTVSQDVRGQFKSIQEALNQLAPGQAIQVLGPGPYREQFKIPELPSDTGIFSRDGAVIECQEWQEVYQEPDATGKMHQVYSGHILGRPRGFRLNGLTFTFPARGKRRIQRMTFLNSHHLIIENCVIRATDGGEHQFINVSNWGDPAALPMAATVRNCVIESQLWFAAAIPRSKILVEKNLFLGPTNQEHLVIADSHLASAVVRNNVITTKSEGSITIARLKHCDHLEIVNNTLEGINGIYFISTCPKPTTIRNNLHSGTGSLVVLIEGAHEQLGNLFQNQEFDHNAYHTMMVSSAGPVTTRSMIGDRIGDATFLSNAAENPDYLRVSRDDQPLSKGGVGGDLPTYIGALPPGPIGDRGDWFTSLQTRRLKSAPNTPPVATPEMNAPELEEWLKGRTILTVSQDGRGQFKSIQEALNQIAPGQAVEVLDRGPYHERLHVTLPADCGLFSRVQTIIGFPRWELSSMASVGIDGKPLTNHQGHELIGSEGFRLHGFDLQFPPLDGTYEDGHLYRRLTFRMPRDCVIENCLIRRVGLGSYEGEAVEVVNWESEMSVVLRDCVIDGALAVVANRNKPLAAGDRGARIFLQRVCFPGTTMHHQLLAYGNALKELSVRDCIFAGAVDANIFVDDCQPHTAVEVTNCYLNGDRGIWFHKMAPETGVVVRNNLRTGDGIVYFDEIAGKFRDQAQQRWQVGHNAYGFVNTPNAPPVSLRKSATDVITKPQFLATNFDAPNAFRLSSDDQLGRSGAAEDLPAYIGPLPPGPAPVEGDWFTRLQKLWFDKRMSEEGQPAKLVTEPGPLDEWLKGRTILTVAQDGSGQFQTIQAALDALQAGQVVQVLDQGPYRERLELHTPPADIGLISSVQTRVELTDLVPSEGVITGRGHFVEKANGLRIHGFEFQIPQSPANVVTIGFHMIESRGVVLEDCAVRRPSSPESQSLVVASVRGGIAQPTVIRDCYIEQGLQIYTLPPAGSALVTRNYISGDLHGLMAGGSFQHCVIRNNIFSKTLKFPFIQQVVHADWFELSNNSFFSISEPVLMESLTAIQLNERAIRMEKGDPNPAPPVERGRAPTGRGAIYNNLHNRPGFLKVTGGAEDESWTWQVGYNCYPGDGGVPARNALPRESNIMATPIFYSIVPGEPNFARLQPESPGATSQAGGKWPNYTGALPPGPVPADGDWFSRLQQRWMKQE